MVESRSKRSVLGVVRRRGFRPFLALCFRFKALYATVILLQLGVTAAALFFAETNRELFDMAPDIPRSELIKLVLAFVAFIALGLLFTLTARVFNQVVNTNVVFEMRRMVLSQLAKLSLSYHESQNSSHSKNILFNELEVFKHFIVFDMLKLISLPITFLSVGLYLLAVHPVLGFIALLVGPLQLFSNLIIKERYKNLLAKQQELGSEWFFHIGETLAGIREIKMNQLETATMLRVGEVFKRSIRLWISIEKMWAIREVVRVIPEKIGYIVGIAVGGTLLVRGDIGVGGLVAFITLLDKAAAPFSNIVEIIHSLQKVSAGAEKLLDVMEMETEDHGTGIDLPSGAPSITFRHVNFHYEEGREVLNDVSFHIPAGSSVAFVGPSGGGKSTIVKLLYRFYKPQSGGIQLNEVPIEEYRLQSLRGNMASVSQDVILFDGSIRENIAMGAGHAEATQEEVERAASLSQSEAFVSTLPERYETKVGERGIKLSQGQKQRIAIARAIMRNASILVLDEPTSALDVETEAMFQNDLKMWGSSCTTLIIAHRLTTIRDVDYVFFLENGEIREKGTPSELLIRRNGRFRAFWAKQERLEFAEEQVGGS